MTWKDDATASSLAAMRGTEPPSVNDSDLVIMAINRLQRAVVKMEALEYDAKLAEHLTRAAEVLGWVAHSMLQRVDEPEPEPEPILPARGVMHIASGSGTACGKRHADVTHITDGVRYADCVECLRTVAQT